MENAIKDTKPVIPPITALSAAESNLTAPKRIRKTILITDVKLIKIKNTTPPIYGTSVKNPPVKPIIILSIVINFIKDMFNKTLRFYLIVKFYHNNINFSFPLKFLIVVP